MLLLKHLTGKILLVSFLIQPHKVYYWLLYLIFITVPKYSRRSPSEEEGLFWFLPLDILIDVVWSCCFGVCVSKVEIEEALAHGRKLNRERGRGYILMSPSKA